MVRTRGLLSLFPSDLMRSMLRLLPLAAVLLVAGAASAQTTTQSCPATPAVCQITNGQTINNVIRGDTTSTGARKNLDRVYELARDGIYLMDADIRNTNYHLRIYGATGGGALPEIYTSLNPNSGNRVGDAFGQEGDITFRDFVFAGVLPAGFGGELPNMSVTFVRVRNPGFDLVMDGVIAVNLQAQIIRAQAALRKFEMTNSMWINSGWLGQNGTNFGAGKGIDLRDGSIDSLVFRNNTFVNYTDRIIRHRSSTGPIRVMIFDHNTILNAVSYHGTLALGQVGETIRITNNLFVDSFVAGADTSDIVRQSEFDESGEVYANGKAKMTWILSEPNTTTNWVVSNNYYHVSPSVQAFYTTYGNGSGDDGNPDNGTDGDNDIIGAGAPLTDHIRGRIANPDAAFTMADVQLTNRPAAPVAMVTWYRTPKANGGAGRTKDVDTFDPATDDYDRRDVDYFTDTFDASYPITSPAYIGGSGACPAGDLNWFPARYAVCSSLTVANEGPVEGRVFELTNAPNPFGGATTVRFTLPEAGTATLAVFDALGRQVATLAEGPMAAGPHEVRWAAADAAPGVYVVRLQAGDRVGTHRVLVVR